MNIQIKPELKSMLFAVVAAILVCIAITGCATEKQRARICKSCSTHDSTVVHDTTYTTYRDTVIDFKFIKGPVSYLPSPCQVLCDSLGNLKPYKHVERQNGLISTLETHGNVLVNECDADSLTAVVKIAKQSHERLARTYAEKVVKVNDLTKWQGFCYVSGLVLWVIALLYALYRLVKFILKKYFPLLNLIK